jgi:hypothetical protein
MDDDGEDRMQPVDGDFGDRAVAYDHDDPLYRKRIQVAMLNNEHMHIVRQLQDITRMYPSVWAKFLARRLQDGTYLLPMLVAADNTSRTRFSGLQDKLEVGYIKFVIPVADVYTSLQRHSWATLLFLAEGMCI